MKQYLYRLFQWLTKGIPVVKVPVTIVTNSDKRLSGRKILVTGGSSGIGRHIAKQCVDNGAEVVIVGRDEEKLRTAADEIGCRYISYDLTNIAALPDLVSKAAEMLSGLDGLVNNAGKCNIDGGFLNVTTESYDEQFLLNTKSPFFLTQAFLKHIEQSGVGRSSVVFILSERGLYPDDAPYGMTKAAMGNIIPGIARQFATRGVHINGIAPGVVASTDKDERIMLDAYLKGAVSKRYVMPEEVAETAVWLLSDESQSVSGQIIAVNQSNHLK